LGAGISAGKFGQLMPNAPLHGSSRTTRIPEITETRYNPANLVVS